MDLPELCVATTFFASPVCAVCDRPCSHEVDDGRPIPGAYVAATCGEQSTELPAPICDPCVERHYPERVADVEADRLHYWMN